MKIAVGSRNPVKIAAVRNIAVKVWPDAEIVSVDVPTGVKDQPRCDEETIEGAKNRARSALESAGADLGIGMEGGVHETPDGMFLCDWAAVYGRDGTQGIGGSIRINLPEQVASEIRKGRELGPVMDEFTGRHNTKQQEGAVGVLTGGLITRTSAFEKAVSCALAKFINPNYYKGTYDKGKK